MPLPIFLWARLRPSLPQLAQSQDVMLLGFFAMALLACAPVSGHTDEFNTDHDQRLADELQLIKEEDGVTVPMRHERPSSQPP
jgi:hypothetical protein